MAGTLTSQEVFRFLTPDQVDTLSEKAERLSLKAGERVYEMGDPAVDLFIVLHGEITLRIPGPAGISILIDRLKPGAIFGGTPGINRPSYALTARCSRDAHLLRIKSEVMKSLMEKDLNMAYPLQAFISNAYFNRYIDTMKKLQAIVMNLPVDAGADMGTSTP